MTTREQWLTSSNYWEPVAKWATTTTILSPTDCATKLHLSVSSSVKTLDVFHMLEGDQSIMMMLLIIIILMIILIVIIPFSRPISSGIFISISDSSRLRESPIQKLTNLIEHSADNDDDQFCRNPAEIIKQQHQQLCSYHYHHRFIIIIAKNCKDLSCFKVCLIF